MMKWKRQFALEWNHIFRNPWLMGLPALYGVLYTWFLSAVSPLNNLLTRPTAFMLWFIHLRWVSSCSWAFWPFAATLGGSSVVFFVSGYHAAHADRIHAVQLPDLESRNAFDREHYSLSSGTCHVQPHADGHRPDRRMGLHELGGRERTHLPGRRICPAAGPFSAAIFHPQIFCEFPEQITVHMCITLIWLESWVLTGR